MKSRPLRQTAALAAAVAALLLAWTSPAWAYSAADSDAVILEAGSANIIVAGTNDLIAGTNYGGSIRLGLFWTFFIQLGYGAVTYDDTATIAGAQKNISFRTTGANGGLGFLIPIRKVQLGFLYVTNPDNKWEQQQKDVLTGNIDVKSSGSIDFDSYYVFARLGKWFELGARRDFITKTDSLLTNSFGPYVALTIPLN